MTSIQYTDVLQRSQKLSVTEQLMLMEALAQHIKQKVDSTKRHSIMELEGLGAELWTDIDVEAYIDQERDSWQS
ncbi:MAG: hypothetical protein M9965_13975 [Anaerolineae bacterium]|nr:hypothetical protein [Anaerolineae bacterium]